MNNYSLIKAGSRNYEFLKRVHHETLRDHIIKLWGWNEQAQDEFFKKEYETGGIQIIQFKARSVGYLHVKMEEQVITIANILILPEYQNKGLGSEILKDLIIEARTSKRLLKLGVFKINGRAKKLYESLGFKVESETETHYLMQM